MNLQAFIPVGVTALTINGLCQWDYGRKLEIHAEDLPAMVEVHFACPGMAEAEVRSCANVSGVIEVPIPDPCLEQAAPIKAWIFNIEGTQGFTAKTITLNIEARTRPQPGATIQAPFYNKYTEVLTEINKIVAETERVATSADRALEADRANEADYASEANHAIEANHATESDHATTADYAIMADRATTADTASRAEYAATAVIAQRAASAKEARVAAAAAHADKATKLTGTNGAVNLEWQPDLKRFYLQSPFDPGLYLMHILGASDGVNMTSQPFLLIIPRDEQVPLGEVQGTEFHTMIGNLGYYGHVKFNNYGLYKHIWVSFRSDMYYTSVNVDDADLGYATGARIQMLYKKIMEI